MDKLNQLRGAAGGSGDSTFDTTSPPSEAFITANESSSKYFSLSEVDSTFDISPIKDVSLASARADPERNITDADELISNLSPISKKSDMLDSYKIGKQIEAANILSGGVDIFDDNDNSYDGDELVIDDNVELEEKSNTELKQSESVEFKPEDSLAESTLMDVETDIASKDTEVVLQIDGKNVDAIDIGNGLYLYRKEGQEELAAVQIIDDDQHQPSFKFLKVRENTEGNLEVYEEIKIEVPKEVPVKEGNSKNKNTSHVPIKDINKVINDASSNKVVDKTNKPPQKETTLSANEVESEIKDISDSKSEVNLNGKMMKFSESRKSPVIGTFTPMTFHSTPNKEGIPLTKTMVDMQLQPSRHSDNVKKTIEVHTDSCKQKNNETSNKNKAFIEDNKETEISAMDNEEITTVDKESELERLKNEPKKTDIIHSEKSGEDKGSIKSNKCEDTNQITSESLLERTEVLNCNKIQGDMLITKLKKNTPISSDASEKKNAENIPIELSQSKNNIDEKIIRDPKDSKTDDSVISQNTGIDKITIEKSQSTCDAESNLKTETITTTTLRMDSNSTVSNTKEEHVISTETSELMPVKPHAKSEVKDIHKTNDYIEHHGKIETKSNVETDCSVDDTLIITSKKIERALPTERDSNIPDNDQLNVVIDDKKQNSLDEKDVSDVIEIKDESHVKNEAEIVKEFKKETNNKLMDTKSICDKTKEKQVTAVEIIKQTNAVTENSKVDEDAVKTQILSKEDVKPTTKCVEDIKQTQSSAETQVEKRVIENQITVVDEKHSEIINTNTKKKQISKLDDEKKISKTALEKQIPIKVNEEHEANRLNITSQEVGTVDKIETKTNNNEGKILKTVSIINSDPGKPTSAMTEITWNKTTVSTAVKNEITESKKEISKVSNIDPKPINNNAAVPFGKWTEANRQEFLNKIKETKVPVNISNSKPIKNSNDLNRRDVLKKIDSQRSNSAAAKAQESNKTNIKNETVFTNKPIIAAQDPVTQNVSQDSKLPIKVEAAELKNKAVGSKKIVKQEATSKALVVPTVSTSTVTAVTKKETVQRKAVNAQDLIDKTIEGMINKGYLPPKVPTAETKSNSAKDSNVQRSVDLYANQPAAVQPTTLDAIEMKMNELHGIPFIERPPHELPRPNNPPFNNFNKVDKEKVPENKPTIIPNVLPCLNKNAPKLVKENVVDVDSEEEILEHEPITGDIEIAKKDLPSNLPLKAKVVAVDSGKVIPEATKKETIITENDFDKFARRNSVTYENCITVSFDGKEPHNVIQTVVEKEILKNYSKIDQLSVETKTNLAPKLQTARLNTNPIKAQPALKTVSVNEDSSNKNYQSKLQIAYQSAITAKRHMEGPITVLEDKPVKVVYMDANTEFIPSKLNVQGQNLSPAKKQVLELETVNTNESPDLDTTETINENKLQDESKPKPKHQRKQVLTPVEAPELELIQPSDLGIEVSPKKKRKTEDARADKNAKNVIHKKSYLLGRSSVVEDRAAKPLEATKIPAKETIHRNDNVGNKETVTALDNLVKAAELLENQSETMNRSNDPSPDSQPSTPVKRGRGRPRKYPLPEGTVDKNKVPSPQKKPRLIDAKPHTHDTTTEEEDSSDEEIVRENWTMGKINENIVCPICNKLFRSENVVFKHVKHCTGPSPNRSDADKRISRRARQSQESDSKSEDMDIDEEISKDIKKFNPKQRRSYDSSAKSDTDKEEIIVIEDTPVKEKSEKDDDRKHHESRKLSKTKIHNRLVNNLVCEFCGKTFRQLSYLANHKLQHKNDDAKKCDKDVRVSKSVFRCDVCKKEFRKLHHLVQHRLIHNPQIVSSKLSRKSSSELDDGKSEKEYTIKQNEDPSAGFRCEPCDKSFRKLHHLVEHRETHDGINRQKGATSAQAVVEKPTPPPQCEICKKTFRKLHHLIEHKEQHLETSSEKSDDKSVKSSLSTRDIIHECPLCYMVFPNEHSLNKHSIICQRKKRQSKQLKPAAEEDSDTLEIDENTKAEESKLEDNDEPEIIPEEVKVINLEKDDEIEKLDAPLLEKKEDVIKIIDNPPPVEIKEKAIKHHELPKDDGEAENPITKTDFTPEVPEVKIKVKENEVGKIQDVPKKKTPLKGKVASTLTKRQKIIVSAPAVKNKSQVDTSDDDEVRYMLNPDFKVNETSEGKIFMKVRAKKRSSLQIERPNSKDLIKRRTSLQHPPKIPRLKPKPIEPKVVAPVLKNIARTSKLEPMPSTDSDDSDVKYSFPKTIPERTSLRERPSRDIERKPQRKSLAEKRKTLSGIAKRKSLGKTAAVRLKETTTPSKKVKRRTAEVEHRCDCGQLFSSAALLSRHTTLAHTPPRIRKRRSPPPEIDTKTVIKPAPRKSTDKPKQSVSSRKSSIRSDTTISNPKSAVSTRKSSVKNDAKSPPKLTKAVEKAESNSSNVKGRRSIPTRATPLPDKTKKKSTQKSK